MNHKRTYRLYQTDKAYIEAFDGRLRAERLNAWWFLSLADVRKRIEKLRCYCNEGRPHTALDGLTSRAFANQVSIVREFTTGVDQKRGQLQSTAY